MTAKVQIIIEEQAIFYTQENAKKQENGTENEPENEKVTRTARSMKTNLKTNKKTGLKRRIIITKQMLNSVNKQGRVKPHKTKNSTFVVL